VDWSWDLLSAPERALLRRVSVFAGSWTLGAAEEVCAAGLLPGAESADGGGGGDGGDGDGSEAGAADLVLDLTDSLVEKSLVVAQHTPGGTRYRLLDTIRAYAAERLAEAGEAERLRVAHTEWALRLLRTADPWLRRAGQLEWLARLTAEHDNLHAALHRAVAAGDTAAGLRLVAALSTYWLLRGMRHEGAGPAARLLAATGTEPPEELRDEYALTVLAALVPLDDTAPLAAHVALTREIVESGGRISARYPTLSLLWAPVAGAPEAEVDIPALTADFIAAKGEDRWYRALVRLGTGFQHWLVRADPVAAGAECGRALADFRALGERWGMMTTLTALASIAESLGDLDRARAHVDEALTLAGELGATVDIAEFLCQRAGFLARAGQYAAADADHERAMALFRRAGAPEGLAAARAGLAATAWLRGDLPAARRRYEQALAECPSGWFAADSVRSLVLAGLGRVAVARGDAPGARRALADALAVLRGARDLPGTAASAAEGLAGLAFLDGDAERTAELLGITSALRGAPAPPAAGPGNARVAGAAGVSGAGGSAEVAETGPGNASAHGSARAAADPGAVDQAAGAKAGAADRPTGTGTGAADSGTVDGASDADTDTASRAATDAADAVDRADASAAERAAADADDPRDADADARNLPRAARPPYPADAASLAAAARAVLGADAYAAAFERGARRSLDDALALLGAELAH
jgi:tetratricopeptide (TPR) repeat protein